MNESNPPDGDRDEIADYLNSAPLPATPQQTPVPGEVHVEYSLQYVIMFGGKPMVTLEKGTDPQKAMFYLNMLNSMLQKNMAEKFPGQPIPVPALVEIPCKDLSELDLPAQGLMLNQFAAAPEKKIISPKWDEKKGRQLP